MDVWVGIIALLNFLTESTLQEIILSLMQVAGQSEISASELRQFLRMFQNNTETTVRYFSSNQLVIYLNI